jgi:pyruvate-ferredoxin/flavodoxin oxidoreductase
MGMGKSQMEEEKAVKAGYWNNYRFNPALKEEGKAAFILDSKAPTESYEDFLNGEVRYNSLKRANPEKAERLFTQSAQDAKERYEYLQKLVTLYGED